MTKGHSGQTLTSSTDADTQVSKPQMAETVGMENSGKGTGKENGGAARHDVGEEVQRVVMSVFGVEHDKRYHVPHPPGTKVSSEPFD
jgi:hypothetical protein